MKLALVTYIHLSLSSLLVDADGQGPFHKKGYMLLLSHPSSIITIVMFTFH